MEVRGVTGTESRVTLFHPSLCHGFETFDFKPCNPCGVLDHLQSEAFGALWGIERHSRRPLRQRILMLPSKSAAGARLCLGEAIEF